MSLLHVLVHNSMVHISRVIQPSISSTREPPLTKELRTVDSMVRSLFLATPSSITHPGLVLVVTPWGVLTTLLMAGTTQLPLGVRPAIREGPECRL
jgi:hypothetical protein